MKSITIEGSKRESVGKKATKALRNAGRVPCVLYGGDQPVHFSAPELAFSKLVYTPDAHTVEIAIEGGDNFAAVLQDIQFHPVTDRILHIDFYQLFEDKPIVMEIPVHVIGTSKGVLNGGVLRKNNRKLRIKAIPSKLPDYLEVDITPLKIGGKIYVGDLRNDDYDILHTDNTVVVMIKTARAAIVDDIDDEDEDEEGVEGAEGAEGAAEGEGAEGGDSGSEEKAETQE